MPTVSDHGGTTLEAIARWKTTAADEVDGIGGWRDADPKASAIYWGTAKLPAFLYTDTTYLVGELSVHFPKLDPTPIQDVCAAVESWHNDHDAARVPPQPILLTLLDRAMTAVNALESVILSRATDGKTEAGAEKSDPQTPPGLPPLSEKAANVYEILKALPPHRALTGPAICDEYQKKHDVVLDESSLRKHLLPQLERHGLKHTPRVGYSLQKP